MNTENRCLLQESNDDYMDCSCILVSVGIIERMWPTETEIMSDSRKSMNPIIFEARVFLKINRQY